MASDLTTSAVDAPADTAEKDAPDLLARARDDYTAGYERDRLNIEHGYEDLEFLGGEQWPADVKLQREADGRPCQTINRLPQFVRQITGDIRQMRPAIKAVPVDDRGDPKTAEVIAGLVRYIENRSDASSVYFTAADSQVQAGIGHWRVVTEYAGDTTLNQEIAVRPVDDGVSVIWDPDATLLSREDAEFCFVPVDLSKGAFAKRYPGKSATAFGDEAQRSWCSEWYGDDYVRVAEYWFKEATTRTVLVVDDDVTDITDDEEAMASAPAIVQAAMGQGIRARLETRPGTQIMRALISGCEILEDPAPWPGRFFPIVPVIGEEIRIGRKVIRHGAIRFAKDAQRMYNYFHTSHTETVALQPKAPWLGTEKQFENHTDEWERANTDNLPFLQYTPDPQAPGPPSRVQAPVSSQGISDGIRLAADDLQATTGIYNSSLGAESNETSGRAIQARQREGDTGTYVYTEHFGKAVAHTGRIIVDLIPHVYDTSRTIRIVGLDGKEDLVQINQPNGLVEQGEGEDEAAVGRALNDVTVGAYDVVMEMGPSYNTRREEARDGMTTFVQAAPQFAPAFIDLIAKNQDWPNADAIAERLEALAPPPIQALLAKERGEAPAAPPPPSPEQQAAMAQQQRQQQLEEARHALDMAKLQVEQQKLQAEMAKIDAELQKATIEADTRRHEASATVAATQAGQPAADPRVDQLAAVVQQMQGILHEVVAALSAPPPDPGPPPLDPAYAEPDPTQPAPSAGFSFSGPEAGPAPIGQP